MDDESMWDEYVSFEDCYADGTHLMECDDDGYCNRCGEQAELPREACITAGTHLVEVDEDGDCARCGLV